MVDWAWVYWARCKETCKKTSGGMLGWWNDVFEEEDLEVRRRAGVRFNKMEVYEYASREEGVQYITGKVKFEWVCVQRGSGGQLEVLCRLVAQEVWYARRS